MEIEKVFMFELKPNREHLYKFKQFSRCSRFVLYVCYINSNKLFANELLT